MKEYILFTIFKSTCKKKRFTKCRGLLFRVSGENEIFSGRPGKIVPQNKIEVDIPGYAWDLLRIERNHLICIELTCGMQSIILMKLRHLLRYIHLLVVPLPAVFA